MSDEARTERARARRARLVIRRSQLGDRHDLTPIAGPAAIALAARLSRYCWTMAGQELRECARSELQIRFTPSDAAGKS